MIGKNRAFTIAWTFYGIFKLENFEGTESIVLVRVGAVDRDLALSIPRDRPDLRRPGLD